MLISLNALLSRIFEINDIILFFIICNLFVFSNSFDCGVSYSCEFACNRACIFKLDKAISFSRSFAYKRCLNSSAVGASVVLLVFLGGIYYNITFIKLYNDYSNKTNKRE